MQDLDMDMLVTRVEATWEDPDDDSSHNVDRAISLAMSKLGNGFRELLSKNGYVTLGNVLNKLDDAKDEAEMAAADASDEDSMQRLEATATDRNVKLDEVENSGDPLWRCKYDLIHASPVSCDDFTEMMHSYQYLLQHQ